jgi:signal transduction histidine kinase
LLLAATCAAFFEPKRVMILHPFGREFVPWNEYGKTFREELLKQSPEGINLYETSLVAARSDDIEEGPFAEYLKAVFAKHRLDLVVGISDPAIRFIQRHRQDVFPSVPAVFMGVEQRRVPQASLTKSSYIDPFLGNGIVGGPLISISSVGRQAASAAARILRGEVPGDIQTPPIRYTTPRFDWRELQRWNIAENRLPAGSEVYFRSPGVWEQYRTQIIAGMAALLIQAAIIAWLLVERRRRYFAQAEASSRRRQVVRLNRVTTANVLSSSIAHELNQPLGAILSNTEAAQMLLETSPPDLAQIGEILCDIIRDQQRAGEIILGLRNFLKERKEADLQVLDLNDTVPELVKIVAPEMVKRGVVLRTVLAPDALPVRADPIHMQQVIINLVMNGMDAMEAEARPRNLTICTRRNAEYDFAEVSVSDSGKGILENDLTNIFDPFVTTKPQGTGLGLPIARTIVESYGGTIWAENRRRGAVFIFMIPLAKVRAG